MAERFVVIRGDGVTYRHGHRAPIDHAEPIALDPSREHARDVARAFLAGLSGEDAKLRAGWLAIRWLEVTDGAPSAWVGPAWLVSFDRFDDGSEPVVEVTGEDTEVWPLPE